MEEGSRGPLSLGRGEAPKRRLKRQPKPPDLIPGGFPYYLEFEGEEPPPFKLLCRNYYRYRSHAEVAPDDIPVCHCTPPESSQVSLEEGAANEGGLGEQGLPVRRGCSLDKCLNALLSTECTPGHCPTGEACQNQRFQRCEYKRIQVRKVEGRGWGMIAAEDIEAGAFVMEYCGEVVPIEVAARRLEAYERAGEKNVYTLELSSAECIDPTQMGAPARFINHSCDPNCETRKWTVLGEVRVGVFTRRFVPAGTELTYDYNFQWYGGEKVRCRCGAACCVGFLGAKSRGFQEEFEDNGEDAVPWHAYDDLFDVEQIPTYDSSSGEDERAGAALEKWAAYRGLSRGASESSEEREAEGQGDVEGEREVGYDLGFEEDSPAGMLPPDSEGPSDASGLPRKRRRAASGQARDGAGPQGEHSEAATDEAAVAAEDALFLDEWEELEDAPEEDPAQEGKGEGAVALASVAAMMDRKRRSSRRQESTGDSSERGRERTRKAASALRKGREEKPSAAKPEEGTSWLNRTHTDSVQRLIRGLVRPPLEPTVRDSLLSRVAMLHHAQESFLCLRGPVEEEVRLRSSGGAGAEREVPSSGASGDALQEQMRSAWLDGLESALDLRTDLAIALLGAQQRVAWEPALPLVPPHHGSMLGTAQGASS